MKDKHAIALGKKGGKARAAKLSKERRIEIARKGYKASPISKPKPESELGKAKRL